MMPANFTIFLANYLIFVDVLAAAVVIAGLLYRRPRFLAFRWAVAAAALLVLSYIFAQVGGLLYNDPRPFIVGHFQPLISHAADNGFPSDHALLAAALVALVALVDLPWALPFALLAIVIDWARVGAGLHHVIDVVGSSVVVALATLIALLLRPVIVRWLAARLPNWASSGQRSPLETDEHRSA
jgi:undecaprenyl-diphosphatase